MSLLLALDTGNRWTGVALTDERGPKAELHAELGRRQAGQLPLMVEHCLGLAGAELSDLTHLAITTGPGYFTSLRVGLAYGLTLAWSLGASVVPVGSLQALSLAAQTEDPVAALIAASKTTVFAGLYCRGELLEADRECTVAELAADPAFAGVRWVAACDGRFDGQGLEGRTLMLPRGTALETALWAWNRRHQAVSPLEIEATYLREPGMGK